MQRQDVKSLMELEPSQQTAEARREIANILLASVRDIELQLSNKERTGPDGVKLSAKEYLAWRRKAIKAMNHINERYRQYKTLIREEKSYEPKQISASDSDGRIIIRETGVWECNGTITVAGGAAGTEPRAGEALPIPPL